MYAIRSYYGRIAGQLGLRDSPCAFPGRRAYLPQFKLIFTMNKLLDRIKALFPPALHERVFLVGGSVRDLLQGTSGESYNFV